MPMEESRKSPVKAISVMMVITFLGKFLGLLRDRLLTINYGTGMEANAFLTASRIPRVFFDTIFASAIAASFIPVFNACLTKEGKKSAYDFAGNFISVIALFSLILTVLGAVFAKQLTWLFADGYDAETAALCAQLTQIMMPTIFFTGIAYAFVGILQSLDEFNIPAALSLVSNGVIIAYYYTLDKKFGVFGLAVTFLIAWFIQAAMQVPSLQKRAFYFKPSFKLNTPEMKSVFALMLPVMVSTWVIPINQTINSKFGSRLFDGSGVSAIDLSYNLYTVIVGVFVLSVTNYIFPRLSKQNAASDESGFQKTIGATMHTTMFVVLPMMAGLMLMAEPIVRFIYGGGAFDEFSVQITSRALVFISAGMVGYTMQAVLSRAFFAEHNGRAPLIAGAVSIAVNIALCAVLIGPMDVAGLGIASAVSCTVNGVLLTIPLQRQGRGFLDRAFVKDMGKIAASVLVMVALVWGTKLLVAGVISGTAGKLVEICVPVGVGALAYSGASVLLRVPETEMVLRMIGKVLKRS